MVTAYVLMKVEPGKESEVWQNIAKIKGIREAALTWGFCDMLLKVNVESTKKLTDVVMYKLRKIPKVKDTHTIIVSEYLL